MIVLAEPAVMVEQAVPDQLIDFVEQDYLVSPDFEWVFEVAFGTQVRLAMSVVPS